MTHNTRPVLHSWWALPAAAALVLSGCSDDSDASPDATPTVEQSDRGSDATPTSETDADIDVDSSGDPSAGAQDAEGTASLGTAVATIAVPLPGDWQYEGTYGDGARPYAVLVDASQPFDLSRPGSTAYEESVWVQVETYQVGGESPYGGEMPEEADTIVDQITSTTGGDAGTSTVGDETIVRGDYTENGSDVTDLWVREAELWILARPSNVDVDAYLDGEAPDGILAAVLEDSEIK